MTLPVQGAARAPAGEAIAITDGYDARRRQAGLPPQQFTNRREVDAHTALTRGLADYLSTLAIEGSMTGGKTLTLKAVSEDWEEQELGAVYPSASVRGEGEGVYEEAELGPGSPGEPIPDGRYLVKYSELRHNLQVDLYVTEKAHRRACVAMVEDGLYANLRTGQLVLELPYYWGERAVYELLGVQYVDAEQPAKERLWRAVLRVAGTIPVVSAVRAVPGQPRAIVSVDGEP